jgi:WD40 repeat protein
MVNCLSWSPSGRLLAAGLGDGSASVFSVENRSLVEVARLQEMGHETPVASVLFPSFLPSDSQHVAAQDRLLATLRNDAVINLWDLGVSAAGCGAVNPCSALAAGLAEEEKDQTLDKAMEDLYLFGDQPRLIFGIPHHKKPNWMTSSRDLDPIFPSTLFVADVTRDITAYSIPLR